MEGVDEVKRWLGGGGGGSGSDGLCLVVDRHSDGRTVATFLVNRQHINLIVIFQSVPMHSCTSEYLYLNFSTNA